MCSISGSQRFVSRDSSELGTSPLMTTEEKSCAPLSGVLKEISTPSSTDDESSWSALPSKVTWNRRSTARCCSRNVRGRPRSIRRVWRTTECVNTSVTTQVTSEPWFISTMIATLNVLRLLLRCVPSANGVLTVSMCSDIGPIMGPISTSNGFFSVLLGCSTDVKLALNGSAMISTSATGHPTAGSSSSSSGKEWE